MHIIRRIFLIFILIFAFTTSAFGYENLCSYLMTAYPTDEIQVPAAWKDVVLKLRMKIRTGWIKRGIPNEIAETVLDHSQQLERAVRIYQRNHPEIDAIRGGRMGLSHDLTEALGPDFPPEAKVTPEEKYRIANDIWDALIVKIPEAAPLKELWVEFERKETPLAKLMEELDKLDAAVMALRHEKLGYVQVRDFFPYAKKKLHNPVLVQIFDILLERNFPEVNIYDQYFTLLEVDGNRQKYVEIMQDLTAKILAARAEAFTY